MQLLAIFRILNDPEPGTRAANSFPEFALFLIRDIECHRNLIASGCTSKRLHALDSCIETTATYYRKASPHALSHVATSDLPNHAEFGFCGDVDRVSNVHSRRVVEHK